MKEKEKTARLELRMSEKEKKQLEKKAEKSGVSVSAYVRLCLDKTSLKAKSPDELWALLGELYGIYEDLPIKKQKDLERLILALQEVM